MDDDLKVCFNIKLFLRSFKLFLQGPSRRSLGQRYIYFLLESPAHDNLDYSRFSDFFNWTMTYRRDSDIFAPYGSFSQLSQPTSVEPILKRVRGLPKQNLVAWVVSNCNTNSKREEYVSELQKHISVDVFGGCGTKSCPGARINSGKCRSLLERDYMFYLAFENSKCNDYVTEKFYLALDMDIVPIVMGGANYSAIAPPGSYIDVNDYSSVQELAKELKRLSEAREEYLNFFRWKATKKVLPGLSQMGCNLCKSLHESKPTKIYQDLGTWWRGGGNCQ